MSEEQNTATNEAPESSPKHEEKVIGPEVKMLAQQEPIPLTPPATALETPTMEVHHHPHVHHEKKWKDYLFEFFMLFLAVTAGFLMENQREHYVEHLRVKQYAKSLISDLKSDTNMVNSRISQITRNMNRIDTLLAYVYGKELNQLSNFELMYKATFGSYNPYSWNRATLDQIKSSGSLRYFDNDSIVKKISAYDAFTKHLDSDAEVDHNQNDKISEKKGQIVDMNYPENFMMLVYSIRYDSIKNTAIYEQMRRLAKPLLTGNVNDVKVLANQAVELKAGIRIRRDFELPRLVKDATELISLLEKEYHLN